MGRDSFAEYLMGMKSHREIKEYLLHNDRHITIQLVAGTVQAEMIDKQLNKNSRLRVRWPWQSTGALPLPQRKHAPAGK